MAFKHGAGSGGERLSPSSAAGDGTAPNSSTVGRVGWRDVLSFVAVVVVFAVSRLIGDAIVQRPGFHMGEIELWGWPVHLYEALWPIVPLAVAMALRRRFEPSSRRAFTRAALVVFCLATGFASILLPVGDVVWYSYLKYNSRQVGDAGAK